MSITKAILLSTLLTLTLNIYALDYTITFTSTGASNTIENIEVQNLTQGTTVNVPSNSTLNLVTTIYTSINQTKENGNIALLKQSESGITKLSLYAKNEGITQFSIYSIDGRKVISLNQSLEEGTNNFEICLPNGLFVLQIQGVNFSFTEKIINPQASVSIPTISFVGNSNQQKLTYQKVKNKIGSTIQMVYNTGDCLLYKGKSGNYSTIVTDVPIDNNVINFNFVSCQDADLNNYTTVTIGTQTWMVENLKTTKYSNGDNLSNPLSSTEWITTTTGAWCNYNNDTTKDNKYGKLYNWYAVNDSRKIAPNGWRVSTSADWNTLISYVTANPGTSITLKKALASTIDWTTDTTTGNIGNNLSINNNSGFSALPGGYRNYYYGTFSNFGNSGNWWSSAINNTSSTYSNTLSYNTKSGSQFTSGDKSSGFSVRCVMGY